MTYSMKLDSPLGPIYLASDGASIVGAWLEGQKYFASTIGSETVERPELPVLQEAVDWLSAYFGRQELPPLPPLSPKGSDFRQAVWKNLLEIPYGQVRTYGALAADLGSSPRAIGNAVGHNPISIFIPCHRVMGADGTLTGYAGGVEKKRFLLELERGGKGAGPAGGLR